ncbi:MAG TPA: glycosyltransferase family 2 protein [Candidatus Omnitrophota bacterium]|nr:glycosyltransferase family 2 protein [Candidatus Omnitrophota bacterium]HPD84394.1 glycosyltransferase family 2 protein [Candidatus Omnitrophota bacterium]HRZ03252.1 glycosyltransferase family 2 protein [Candidatus Omnitrophota bacterium]
MNSLSLIIPVYNEEENILPLLSAVRKTIPLVCGDFEVILIDDASTDGTPGILDAVAATDGKIKILHNQKNRTSGGALKEGFKVAGKELVLYFDADLPFDLSETGKAIALLGKENADFISAYRLNRNADGIQRSIYSYIYNAMVNSLFDLGLKDVGFSFKLFKREILENIVLHSESPFINAEMLISARQAGYRILQFPTVYYPRTKGRSNIFRVAVVAKMIQELFRFYFYIRKCQVQEQKRRKKK